MSEQDLTATLSRLADALERQADRPELLGAGSAADVVGVSRSLWYQLHSEARVPSPVRLGKRVLWRRRELEAWTRAGCPSRLQWEEMQEPV